MQRPYQRFRVTEQPFGYRSVCKDAEVDWLGGGSESRGQQEEEEEQEEELVVIVAVTIEGRVANVSGWGA